MLAHKVLMIPYAFQGQQLLQPLAACHTLSLQYATCQAMLRLGAHDSNDSCMWPPWLLWSVGGTSFLCSQRACLLGGRMHRLTQCIYLHAEAVSINASSLHPICYIYFSLEAPALYLVVIRLLYMAHPDVCRHDLHSC